MAYQVQGQPRSYLLAHMVIIMVVSNNRRPLTPAAPMRAVEEVESRPADGPGQDSAGALDCGLGGLPDDQVHGSGQ